MRGELGPVRDCGAGEGEGERGFTKEGRAAMIV